MAVTSEELEQLIREATGCDAETAEGAAEAVLDSYVVVANASDEAVYSPRDVRDGIEEAESILEDENPAVVSGVAKGAAWTRKVLLGDRDPVPGAREE